MRVLFVESGRFIIEATCVVLQKYTEEVHVADSVDECISIVRHCDMFDVVLLGPTLTNKKRVIATLRSIVNTTPIVMLVHDVSAAEEVAYFHAGVDDCIRSEWVGEVVHARMAAALRRSKGHTIATINCGALQIDTARRVVTKNGVPVRMSDVLYRTLEILAQHQGKPVSYDELYSLLYRFAAGPDIQILKVHVSQLRKVIGKEYIDTQWGFGYVFLNTPNISSEISEGALLSA